MNKAQLKRSHALINEVLGGKEAGKGIKQYDKLWEEGDDDQTVIAKFRAYRSEFLAKVRFQLVVAEAAAHQRLTNK